MTTKTGAISSELAVMSICVLYRPKDGTFHYGKLCGGKGGDLLCEGMSTGWLARIRESTVVICSGRTVFS